MNVLMQQNECIDKCMKLLASYTGQKATIHHVTTENVLFPGHNHLLTTGTDDLSLVDARVIIKVLGHHVPVASRMLWPGNMTF